MTIKQRVGEQAVLHPLAGLPLSYKGLNCLSRNNTKESQKYVKWKSQTKKDCMSDDSIYLTF